MRCAKRRVRGRVRLQRRRASPGLRFWSRSRGSCRKRLQFLARLEADSLTRRDTNLLSGARVAADAGLARLYVKYAEAPELDALAAAQCVLHRLEDGFHRLFGFRSSNIRFLYDGVDDVELDHTYLPDRKPMLDRGLQVVKRCAVYYTARLLLRGRVWQTRETASQSACSE